MPADIITRHLKGVPLFKELTEAEIEPIVKIAHVRTYKPRTFVFMQGDPLERVFFIQQGKVKIYKTDINGKEQIVSILKEDDMFPHVGFFGRGSYPAHAELLEESIIVVIPIAEFETILLQYPEVSVKLFRVMGEKIIDLQNRLEEQVLHNTKEQILMLLLRLCEAYGRELGAGQVQLDTYFTNRELANMIGTSRETVSRTLTQLRKKEFIHFNKYGYLNISTEAIQKELFDL
ncbi:Crp/Fnr family transcriptional regulator [Salibacterium aidingense]|uniref:Crp/Fnr family transcriptional regulator n=1 Tax=Salibacterium aidingense TaxID=384933 RepID=UPI00047ACA26|nr:Crp/Fnr family transcriptional regulator [Salibacterium aidingense]